MVKNRTKIATFFDDVDLYLMRLNDKMELRRYRRIVYGLFLLFGFYFSSVYHIEPNEMGIGWNPFTGKLRGDTVSGFYISPPWDLVSNIDVRPKRVCITSTANSYSCLLVTFDKKYWKEFVDVEGFGYYWWRNRFSFNFGYREEYRGFKDVLRGYAFGNKKYKFIIITEDLSTQY